MRQRTSALEPLTGARSTTLPLKIVVCTATSKLPRQRNQPDSGHESWHDRQHRIANDPYTANRVTTGARSRPSPILIG
jgi:hypothetical protein